jgi:hypothetical protein
MGDSPAEILFFHNGKALALRRKKKPLRGNGAASNDCLPYEILKPLLTITVLFLFLLTGLFRLLFQITRSLLHL